MEVKNDSEFVIGIVSTVGTDTKKVIDIIADGLRQFDYECDRIKVSEHILAPFDGKSENHYKNEFDRISFFMDLGNKIRRETGDLAILMKGVSAYIYNKCRGGRDKALKRRAFIIDSIKNPEEISFLRQTYGDGFHLIGISDTYEKRKEFFINRKNMTANEAGEILDRDNDESEKYGQHTGDAFQQADYFIDLQKSDAEIQADIYRLLDLLFGNPFLTPTFEEYAMFRAYVASLRSADLSRQIGAVVVRDDEILAEGVNDCPKAFGGMYWPYFKKRNYVDEDEGRDYTLGFDSNKMEQKNIIDKILENLGKENTEENVRKVKSAGIGSLTEYGRVVHGEMEALLMCARNGIPTKGCSMYMTTFPCHNCAKHIIAAGIKKVVYIEQYPKSKALEFYKHEISTDASDSDGKVVFLPFSGVGPHRFIDLFSMRSIWWYPRRRKDEDGFAVKWDRKSAGLRIPMSELNYIDMEKSASNMYFDEIEKIGEENDE